MNIESYEKGFEESDHLRSSFIRDLTLMELDEVPQKYNDEKTYGLTIPRTLVRYWHDAANLPEDVQSCILSWSMLDREGFDFVMFNDVSAATYIRENFTDKESKAFGRCWHPAMRSDYLRLCFQVADGGLYVDVDDVLISDGWKAIFRDARLKLHPLCYDIPSGTMVPSTDIWRSNLETAGRIFYVNNNPIASPAGHPVMRRALARATEKLLAHEQRLEIQSTTGPGNLTAALASHARELIVTTVPRDFELLRNWDAIAKTRWGLSYRSDSRNWRNATAHQASGDEA